MISAWCTQLGMGLDEKAVEAVRNWTFHPATNCYKRCQRPRADYSASRIPAVLTPGIIWAWQSLFCETNPTSPVFSTNANPATAGDPTGGSFFAATFGPVGAGFSRLDKLEAGSATAASDTPHRRGRSCEPHASGPAIQVWPGDADGALMVSLRMADNPSASRIPWSAGYLRAIIAPR